MAWGGPRLDRDDVPEPRIDGLIVQHRIQDEDDMRAHWEALRRYNAS